VASWPSAVKYDSILSFGPDMVDTSIDADDMSCTAAASTVAAARAEETAKAIAAPPRLSGFCRVSVGFLSDLRTSAVDPRLNGNFGGQ